MTNLEPLRSFHGDPALKQKYINRLKEHRKLGHLVQGATRGVGKGSAIWCLLEAYDHSLFPTELGLPEWLAMLIDVLFEKLPKEDAEQFAEDVLHAISVGVDVEPVKHTTAILRLNRLLDTVPKSDEPYYEEVISAIKQVIEYHKSPSRSSAESANEAAWIARNSAAFAAKSAAEYADWSARDAAWSAECAAESAAECASECANSAAFGAADAAFGADSAESARAVYKQMAQDLIQELKTL